MAKHKPTAATIRQGQTIYWINTYTERYPENRPAPTVQKYFMYSHKQPLPEEGCVVMKMPVSRLRWHFKQFGNDLFYYSKGRALQRAAQL